MSRIQANQFNIGDYVVYPTHGVGEIIGYESQIIAGMAIKLVVLQFEMDKMILRLPENRARAAGLRKLSSKEDMTKALIKLKTKKRIKRIMWSRRAQDYETKINTGHPSIIAEVVRELYKENNEEQSYSERQMYQMALKRLAREFAVVEKINEDKAVLQLEDIMKKVA